jgi:hypothetical protein
MVHCRNKSPVDTANEEWSQILAVGVEASTMVRSAPEDPTPVEVDVNKALSEQDLRSLKQRDPFLYYSIPGVREATVRLKSVDMHQLAQDGLRRVCASCPASIQTAAASTSETVARVQRRTRISFECPADALVEDLMDHHLREKPISMHKNTMSSDNIKSVVVFLLKLLEGQNFQTFQSVALSRAETFREVSDTIASFEEFNGMTLLHAAVRFNPPLTMVAKMIDICPKLLSAKDCMGRTPLHVAAGSKASAALIKLIAHSCPAACDALDEDGKTPLHFACDSSCELFEDDAAKPKPGVPPNYDSILALLSESLAPATMEDIDEMNPLEHAIMSDASMKTIKLLQKASRVSRESCLEAITKSLPMPVSPQGISAWK